MDAIFWLSLYFSFCASGTTSGWSRVDSGAFKSVIRSATPDCSAKHRDMILMNDLYIASPEGVSPKDGQSVLLVISCVGTHRMAP